MDGTPKRPIIRHCNLRPHSRRMLEEAKQYRLAQKNCIRPYRSKSSHCGQGSEYHTPI